MTKYSFNYHLPNGKQGADSCSVHNAHNFKTDYIWDGERRLKEVIRYDQNNQPYTYDRLNWGVSKTQNHGNLLSRTFSHESDMLFCRSFDYDERGNVLKESLYGNISGGNASPIILDEIGSPIESGCEKEEKHYAYTDDGFNLLLNEREGTREKEYVYYPNTNLLGVLLIKSNGHIVKRHIYHYDEDACLDLEIIDDGHAREPDNFSGVTYRKKREIVSSKMIPYAFDSFNNCLSKNGKETTYNALHQPVTSEKTQFEYDKDGNLIVISSPGIQIKCTYDALDRMTSFTKNGVATIYTYDGFNRRMTKTSNGKTEYYLYHDQNEIGCLNSERKIVQLRLLGLGKGAEVGAAVAIELNSIPYAPIHDFAGNVIALIDDSGKLAEAYRYTAFGEEEIYGPNGEKRSHSYLNNPWRFSSKRVDDESGYSFFGRRYYDAKLGRWTTLDPIGFGEINLYAYVSNNPLTRFDLYGLYEIREQSWLDNLKDSIDSALDKTVDFVSGAVQSAVSALWDPIQAFSAVREAHTVPSNNTTDAFIYGQTFGAILGTMGAILPIGLEIGSFKLGSSMTKASYAIESANLLKNIGKAAEITSIGKRALTTERLLGKAAYAIENSVLGAEFATSSANGSGRLHDKLFDSQ